MVHVDVFWGALNMKARSPEKFTNGGFVTVSDVYGFLSLTMTIQGNTKIMS